MTVSDGLVVEMNYTLKDDDGVILDSSHGRGPLSYLQGKGNIISGLEVEMAGKKVGDKFSVSVEPKLGYGEIDQNMIISFPKDQFEGQVDSLEVGMQFEVSNSQNQTQVMSVVKIEEDQVVLDGNHPLAGENLHFEIEVKAVREATEQELEQGFPISK